MTDAIYPVLVLAWLLAVHSWLTARSAQGSVRGGDRIGAAGGIFVCGPLPGRGDRSRLRAGGGVCGLAAFGSPAPIDIQVTGNNQQGNYVVGEKLANELRHIPGAADVHVQQAFDQPTLHMDIERTRVQNLGLQAKDVAQNLLVSLSSSFQTAPAFWLDPKNGVSYNVAVQTPQYRVDTYQALQNTPVTASTPNLPPQILANLVTTSTTARPAVVSHYNVQPMINVYSSVDGTRSWESSRTRWRNASRKWKSSCPREATSLFVAKFRP